MWHHWLYFINMDLDGGCPYFFPKDPHLYHLGYNHIPGSLALQEAFSCISKFAGALFLWFAGGQNSNVVSDHPHGSKDRAFQHHMQIKHIISCRHNPVVFHLGSGSRAGSPPILLARILSSTIKNLWREVEHLQSNPILSLAAAVVPPFDNISKVLALPLVNVDEQISGQTDQLPCGEEYQGCSSLFLSDIDWRKDTVEPRTGIKFPAILDLVAGENSSAPTSEVNATDS